MTTTPAASSGVTMSEYVLHLVSKFEFPFITEFGSETDVTKIFYDVERNDQKDDTMANMYSYFPPIEYYEDDNDKEEDMSTNLKPGEVILRYKQVIRKPMKLSLQDFKEEPVWVEYWNPKGIEYVKTGFAYSWHWEKSETEKELINDAAVQWYIEKILNRPDLIQGNCFLFKFNGDKDIETNPSLRLVNLRDSTEGQQKGMNIYKFIEKHLMVKFSPKLVKLHVRNLIVKMFKVVSQLHELGVYHLNLNEGDAFLVNHEKDEKNKSTYNTVLRGFRISCVDKSKSPNKNILNSLPFTLMDEFPPEIKPEQFHGNDVKLLLSAARDILEEYEDKQKKKERKEQQKGMEINGNIKSRFWHFLNDDFPEYLTRCYEKVKQTENRASVAELINLLDVPDIENEEKMKLIASIPSRLSKLATFSRLPNLGTYVFERVFGKKS